MVVGSFEVTWVLDGGDGGPLVFRPYSTLAPAGSLLRVGIQDLGAIPYESVTEAPEGFDAELAPLPDWRPLWNFQDPAATEANFREVEPVYAASGNEEAHLELLTQIIESSGDARTVAVTWAGHASWVLRIGGHIAVDLLLQPGVPHPAALTLLSPLYDLTFALARAREAALKDPDGNWVEFIQAA